MSKKNIVSINKVPDNGDEAVTLTITVKFDPSDKDEAVRIARALRELIPADDFDDFRNEFDRAAADAGLSISGND
jgi:hypothetical protein